MWRFLVWYILLPFHLAIKPFGAAIGGALLGGALSDRRKSGGFGGVRGGLMGGTGVNPDALREGHRADNKYFFERHNWLSRYNWRQARKRGLTAQEFYGSGAAGAVSNGPSGGASVLGNMLNTTHAARSAATQATFDGMANRETALKQTKMQTDAQVKVAEIQAGQSGANVQKQTDTQMAVARMQNQIEDRKVTLNERSYQEVTLPQAAETLGKTKKETQKLINEIATSTPEFQRSMKLLSMGVENTIQTALLQRLGIDITSKEAMAKLSKKQFEKVLAILFAAGSNVTKELHGLFGATSGVTGDPLYNVSPMTPGQSEPTSRQSLGRPGQGRRQYFQ